MRILKTCFIALAWGIAARAAGPHSADSTQQAPAKAPVEMWIYIREALTEKDFASRFGTPIATALEQAQAGRVVRAYRSPDETWKAKEIFPPDSDAAIRPAYSYTSMRLEVPDSALALPIIVGALKKAKAPGGSFIEFRQGINMRHITMK